MCLRNKRRLRFIRAVPCWLKLNFDCSLSVIKHCAWDKSGLWWREKREHSWSHRQTDYILYSVGLYNTPLHSYKCRIVKYVPRYSVNFFLSFSIRHFCIIWYVRWLLNIICIIIPVNYFTVFIQLCNKLIRFVIFN